MCRHPLVADRAAPTTSAHGRAGERGFTRIAHTCYTYVAGEGPGMRSYSSREILRMLHRDGWVEKNQRGSHIQLVHPVKPGKVTVPHPRKDLDPKTVGLL